MADQIPPASSERRRHYRSRSRPGRRIELRYKFDDGSDERLAVTANIGVGGAFVLTQSPASIGTLLELMIQIPDSTLPLRIQGEVRWVQSAPQDSKGMGIKFAPLDTESLLALSRYLSTLSLKDA